MAQTIGERVKQLRKAQKMNQEKFGQRLGVTASAVSRVEKGENALTDQMLRAICREFGVNEKWLRYGEGEMFHTSTKAEKIAAFVGDALANEPEDVRQRILYAFARLSPEGWELLDDFLDDLQAEKNPAEDPAES